MGAAASANVRGRLEYIAYLEAEVQMLRAEKQEALRKVMQMQAPAACPSQSHDRPFFCRLSSLTARRRTSDISRCGTAKLRDRRKPTWSSLRSSRPSTSRI